MLKNVIKKIVQFPGELYHKRARKRLKNTSPTIISSDCFGGFIYHDMGIKFNSPTVNLYFTSSDFIKLVENLKEFMASDVYEVTSEFNYPLGEIRYNNEAVTIHFMHYSSFEEARNKWNERKSRINYDNIFILQTIQDISKEDIITFEALPYKNKLLLANENPTQSKYVVTHSVFKKNGYKSGKVLRYKFPFALKRYIDDVDYISWLNGNVFE